MTHVKICGITSIEDGQAAADAGADLLGFIFYPKSARYVTPKAVRAITDALSDMENRPLFVGVFVNEPVEDVAHIIEAAGLDYAQLHGGEPPAQIQALQPHAFKALRPSSQEEAQADAEWFGEFGPPDGPQLLIDAYDPDEYGGTGKKADWFTAAGLARIYPRMLLAGGLTPGNVAQAVKTVKPWGVDVSSGVEGSPGKKDHQTVRDFIRNAKEA